VRWPTMAATAVNSAKAAREFATGQRWSCAGRDSLTIKSAARRGRVNVRDTTWLPDLSPGAGLLSIRRTRLRPSRSGPIRRC
jgi:hypothetical protein